MELIPGVGFVPSLIILSALFFTIVTIEACILDMGCRFGFPRVFKLSLGVNGLFFVLVFLYFWLGRGMTAIPFLAILFSNILLEVLAVLHFRGQFERDPEEGVGPPSSPARVAVFTIVSIALRLVVCFFVLGILVAMAISA